MSEEDEDFDAQIAEVEFIGKHGITFREFEHLLVQLDDCNLGDWDYDFLEDMTKRAAKYGPRTSISGRQWEQLQRMKGKYL